MIDNKYYEIAIPLIRTFSKSYNIYYEKLLKASKFIYKAPYPSTSEALILIKRFPIQLIFPTLQQQRNHLHFNL